MLLKILYVSFPRYLKRYGVANAALYATYRLANSAIILLIFKVMTLEPGDLDWSLIAGQDERWKFLGPDELGRFSEQDLSLELDPSFLSAAFARGDLCYGFVENGILGSYTWYATGPTPLSKHLTAYFRHDYIYMYKSFTALAFRGRHLCGIGVSRAFHSLTREGIHKRLVSYVEVHNQPSLKALRRAGFKSVGKAVVLGGKSPRLSCTSPGSPVVFRIKNRSRMARD
ncbi:hypothetical protein [Microvirga calopogonii]|uniref:hypothetical protein n=1 Tax=Microvirga calopogonii TaxID=2078013 RepID=UPI0013B455D9|nr:hypothetical protein [Microvirga calopogonii]